MVLEQALSLISRPSFPTQVRVGQSNVSLWGTHSEMLEKKCGCPFTFLDFSGETASLLDSFLKPHLI